ncbi:PAS domain S-box protein [Maridesulfovibrio frigidus]|uniref:PAS domain S-box protein n=1 Tax=Maridesulfovibrio frigidus TaxID=340956 RepID=UPI000690C04A|nr:PAS domain S-box protein [Maridesulfovibrio frigidus]
MNYISKLGFLIFSFLILSSSSAWAEKKVTLQLRWDYQYQFAGYLAAKWMGYYSQEGLDVEIRSAITPQNEILSAITEVDKGRAQFGIGAADVLIARDKGIPLVLVLSIFQQSPAAFYALAETPINSLADFARLKVARRVNDLIDVELQAMLRSEGIDPEAVIPHKHTPGISNLLNGKVDIVPGYSISFPYELSEAGITPRIINPSQYGIDFYGDSLFTTENVIESDPDMVEAFMRASIRGWKYALNHPQEIADRIVAELPRIAPVNDLKKFNTFQAKGVYDLTLYPVVDLGHINSDRWSKIHQYLKKTGLVKNKFDSLKFIYAPEKRKLAEKERFERIILVGLALISLVLVLALLWIHSLRRLIKLKINTIKESEQRFDLAMAAAQDGLYDWNLVTNEIYYSPGWKKMLGYDDDELSNDVSIWENLTKPEDVELCWKMQQEMINKVRERFEIEFKMQHKEGHWVDILSRAKAIFNAEGKAVRMIGTHVDITDLKQANAELKSSEKRFRLMFENAPLPYQSLNEHGYFLDVNKKWLQTLGYTKDEVVGNWFGDFLIDSSKEDFDRNFPMFKDACLINGVDFKMMHKDGKERDVSFTGRVQLDENGAFACTHCIFSDITKQKQVDESLRRSEVRLQEAHRLAKVGSWEFDLQTGEIWGSDEGFDIYGIEHPTSNLLPVDDIEACIPEKERVHQALVDLIDKDKPYSLEFDIQPADGSARKQIISKAKIERDNKGNPLRVYGVIQDITELKRSQSDLAKSEAYLRKVVTKTPHPMAILNSAYTEVLFYNDSFTKTFGYTLDDVRTAQEWWEAAYPDLEYRAKVIQSWMSVVKEASETNQEITPQEWRMRRKDGEFRDAEFTLMPLDKEFLICVTDLTEYRALVDSLKNAKEMAEAANHAKSEFLANMSHEIRTPINGIMGMLQLLQMTTLNETQQKYAAIGIESSKRLTRLLSDILDLSRVEAGKTQIQSAPFQLEKAVREVMQLFLPNANQANVELRLHFDSDVPPWVMGDKVRLQQIFTNLIGNALKFTHSGSVTVEASLLASPRQEYARILFSVVDTGMGISEEVAEILFEPFTQGSEDFRRGQHGAGLGLSICKRLIGMMDGGISVESELGKGASFYLSIPFIVAESQASRSSALAEIENFDCSSVRVLLAEDDRVSSLAGARLLENLGCIVKPVTNGAAVIDALKDDSFDIVFMDVQMPIMDGIEATQAIRCGEAGDETKNIPIIAMTAYAMSGDREKFIDSGMNDYIAKPVSIHSLKDGLKRVLYRKQ